MHHTTRHLQQHYIIDSFMHVNATLDLDILKLNPDKQSCALSKDSVAVEQIINLTDTKHNNYRFLATPRQLEELITGFLFTQGFIRNANDITNLNCSHNNDIDIKVQLKVSSELPQATIHTIHTSAGAANLNSPHVLLAEIPKVNSSLQLSSSTLFAVMQQLHQQQTLFAQTGATHAAVIFNSDGNIIAFAEDIGRHNALDKVIGHCLINDCDLQNFGVALSSRLSFEMVSKAARAGIGVIVAVSAATSLAIAAAKQWQITLCGFVRENKMNIYCGDSIIC